MPELIQIMSHFGKFPGTELKRSSFQGDREKGLYSERGVPKTKEQKRTRKEWYYSRGERTFGLGVNCQEKSRKQTLIKTVNLYEIKINSH